MRADDQLVRSKAACAARYRDGQRGGGRERIPARVPPRTLAGKPFPDAAAVAAAQRLERLARGIGALEASIQQQPVPENDRMTQRYRQEAATLKVLIGAR